MARTRHHVKVVCGPHRSPALFEFRLGGLLIPSTALSPAQAGKLVGKAKSTILRKIESGELSAQKDDKGNWQIQPEELLRVFDPVAQDADQSGAIDRDGPALTSAELAEARIQIAKLRSELDASEKINAFIEEQMQKWQDQATRLALTDEHKQQRADNAETRAQEAEQRAAKAERVAKQLANRVKAIEDMGFFERLLSGTKKVS